MTEQGLKDKVVTTRLDLHQEVSSRQLSACQQDKPDCETRLSSSRITHTYPFQSYRDILSQLFAIMAQAVDADSDTETVDTYLAPKYHDLTILALRMTCRRKLGMYLNIDAMPLQTGMLPNYQGLAELIGFEFLEQMEFSRQRDPTASLLLQWGNRPDLTPTLGKLVEFLLQLERVDVLEDCQEIMKKDADHYLERKNAGSTDIQPVQDPTVSQSPIDIDDMNVDETAIMTIQDVEKGGPTYYDAFVCYHPEGEDLKFVQTMIEKVECPPYNLKLFVPHRDDLPGASRHVISAELIQKRCKRMVIVMSPRYLQSDACDFQTKFAHALSPGSRSKKLVPVRVTPCETPNILRHVTMCDYTRGDMGIWFWNRLIRSLQAPLQPGDNWVENPSSLTDIEMFVSSPGFPSLPSSVPLPSLTDEMSSSSSSSSVGACSSSSTCPIVKSSGSFTSQGKAVPKATTTISGVGDSSTCPIVKSSGSFTSQGKAVPKATTTVSSVGDSSTCPIVKSSGSFTSQTKTIPKTATTPLSIPRKEEVSPSAAHLISNASVATSSVLLSSSAPPHPSPRSPEGKSRTKKKDFKTKVKSIFSSYTSHR